MDNAVLNSEFIATKAGNITVYNYDGETREYISTSTEYLAVGVGIPAYSCLDAPGTYKAGYAICRSVDFNSWEYPTVGASGMKFISCSWPRNRKPFKGCRHTQA